MSYPVWFIPPAPKTPRDVFTGTELNSKCIIPVVYEAGLGTVTYTDLAPYSYVGFSLTGNAINTGSFAAYVFYEGVL